MFSTFSDPFLSCHLENEKKSSSTEESTATENKTTMEDQLNFHDDVEFLKNFPNLPSPDQSLFDAAAAADGFPEFDEIEHLTNFNLELENFNAGLAGVKRDVLLSDAMLNRQISYDNGDVQLKSDVIKIEQKQQPIGKNSGEVYKSVRFICDEKSPADEDSSSSQQSSSSDRELEILRQTAHEYEKRSNDVIAPKGGRKMPVQSLDDNQKRKFLQYYGASSGKNSTTDFSNSFDNVGREITIGGKSSTTRRPSTSASPDVGDGSGKSRGAMYAKQYRQKNKNLIDKMQNDLDHLTEENTDLRHTVDEMSGQLNSMNQEIRYLRSVLANQSQLSVLLKNVTANAPGTKFRFPLNANETEEEDTGVTMETRRSTRKRKANDDSDDVGGPKKSAKRNNASTTPGVCLHVNGDSVSLEFCARCADDATRCVN